MTRADARCSLGSVRRLVALLAVLWLAWALLPAPAPTVAKQGHDLRIRATLAMVPAAVTVPEEAPEAGPQPSRGALRVRGIPRCLERLASHAPRPAPDLRHHVRRLHHRRAAPRQDEPAPYVA